MEWLIEMLAFKLERYRQAYKLGRRKARGTARADTLAPDLTLALEQRYQADRAHLNQKWQDYAKQQQETKDKLAAKAAREALGEKDGFAARPYAAPAPTVGVFPEFVQKAAGALDEAP